MATIGLLGFSDGLLGIGESLLKRPVWRRKEMVCLV
jgi:hypothetical protein